MRAGLGALRHRAADRQREPGRGGQSDKGETKPSTHEWSFHIVVWAFSPCIGSRLPAERPRRYEALEEGDENNGF
ncbi:hypothetical protein Skr01_49070 [Sphaerisporangium krabiense]|nr:hypothetical protein Skr01_49070 [Sphaerisporangium krabiense]